MFLNFEKMKDYLQQRDSLTRIRNSNVFLLKRKDYGVLAVCASWTKTL